VVETDVIHCGECSEVLATFPDDCIDLTVTSPPYGTLREYNGYVFDFEPIARQLYRVTKPGGVVVWVVNDQTKNGSESLRSFKQVIFFNELGFNVHDTMIYKKKHLSFPDKNRYYQGFDYMFVISKGYPLVFNQIKDRKNKTAGRLVEGKDRNPDGSFRKNKRGGLGRKIGEFGARFNVWEYSNTVRSLEHPAPFPQALARDHIISWSNPGDIVLDPFVGSGTTSAEAKKLNRQYIGIDISAEYCELARRRIANAKIPLPGMEA